MKNRIQTPVLAAFCLLATPAMAQVNYAVSGSTAYVTSSPNASGDIVIASTYNGFPVTRILSQAFLDCTNLTSVTIPNSVTNIGGNAFYRCTGLTNIAVALDNPSYSSPDGVLFNKAQTTLIQFPCGRGVGYAIPNGVTVIAPAAFYRCTGLTNVMIPNTVFSIGLDAFSGCTGLTGVTIPDSVTTIQSAAFYACTGLTSVTIPISVTGIGSRTFARCTSLTNIAVAASNTAYSSLGGILFNKAQTTLIQFPGGRGGSYAIPNGVANIGLDAFTACAHLTSLTMPNTVVSIEFNAFYACYGLTSVTMGSSVTSIGVSAFSGCTNLTSLTIPESVTTIGLNSFSGCTSLTNVMLGRSVTSIGDAAFIYCRSLRSVTIPSSVTNLGFQSFLGCTSLTNLTVAAANPAYSSINGVLFNKAQTILIQFPGGRGGGYAIPNGITNVGSSAFYFCTSLTNVTIPNSVISIGSQAFYFCSRLTTLTFLGNAPILNGAVFYDAPTAATVYYYYGTANWGPTYGGLPTLMLGAPAPQISSSSTGVKPGGFGFALSGVANQTIVVEASTNLTSWQPIWTNTLSGVSTNFVDPQWLNHPHRFYRLRSN
jgi:hypothetical protein